MSELLGVKVIIHALWHAGSYDPQDFLGRLIGDAPWVRHAEKSFFAAIDHNYFATEFHIEMFCNNLLTETLDDTIAEFKKEGKIIRSGWPMEYMLDTLLMYKNMPKRDLILFPHRLAPEKQLPIFEDLRQHLPQYDFKVCQEYPLSKNEYHNLLGESKMIFSANLQETLGISWYEGALVGAIPMVPDRLSYKEMALDTFKYPSEWTESWDAYTIYRKELCNKIIQYMENYEKFLPSLNKQVDILTTNYFSCSALIENLN